MGKKKNSDPDKKMFFDTLRDMRKLIQKNTNSYTANTLGLGNKTKVPYDHLMGRRNSIKQKYKQEKARAHEESIQYDSSMQLLNSGLMKQKKQKDEHEKNKYKFSGAAGGIGRENGGFLQISKHEANRIMGINSGNKGRKNDKKAIGGKFGKKKRNFGKKGKSKRKHH